MIERSITARWAVIAALLLGAVAVQYGFPRNGQAALRQPLKEMPLAIGEWQGADSPLAPQVLEVLRMDEYLNRSYRSAGLPGIDLYVGFFGSQRTGGLIHSPKHCMPGSGWYPVRASVLTFDVPGHGPAAVNEYLLEKGSGRLLVLYWYHGRGRVTASEYHAKFWLVLDSIRRNRTDGALVRIITLANDGETAARARAVAFAQALFPHLSRSVPE